MDRNLFLSKAMNAEEFICEEMALGAYRNAGDPRVTQALQKALDDTKHKVCHIAARILGVGCPGCGRTW